MKLKEKYNVVLNIIICYNIKENFGDYYEKSYITCNNGLKNICPIDEYTMIKVDAKFNGIYFCKKCYFYK